MGTYGSVSQEEENTGEGLISPSRFSLEWRTLSAVLGPPTCRTYVPSDPKFKVESVSDRCTETIPMTRRVSEVKEKRFFPSFRRLFSKNTSNFLYFTHGTGRESFVVFEIKERRLSRIRGNTQCLGFNTYRF